MPSEARILSAVDIGLLIALVICAVLACRTMIALSRRLRASANEAFRSMRWAAIDVWIPLAIVLPAAVVAMSVDRSAMPAGGIFLSLPVAAALIAAGVAMVVLSLRGSQESADGSRPFCLATAGAAGIVLLLVAAADRLTVGVGQAAFAACVVLAWFNLPEAQEGSRAAESIQSGLTGLVRGLLTLLGLAVAESIVVLAFSPDLLRPVAGLLILQMSVMLSILAIVVSATGAIRVGLWAAAYGVLLSLGLLSVSSVVPAALSAIRGDLSQAAVADIAHGLAGGFGYFAYEATLLALLPAGLVAARHLAGRPQLRIAGACLILLGAALAAIRIAGL